MKFRKTIIVILLLFVAFLITACSSETADSSINSNSEASTENAAEDRDIGSDSIPLPLLEQAKVEFQNNNSVSDSTLEQIMQNKSTLLPIVRAGLNLDSLKVDSNYAASPFSPYREWDFWLYLTSALDDRQLLQSLTEWLTASRPIPNSYRLGGVLNALIPKGQEDILINLMDQATAEGMTVILEVLRQRGILSGQQIDAWAKKYEEKPQILGIISFLPARDQANAEKLTVFYDNLILSPAARRQIVDSLISSFNYRQQLAWLKNTAIKTKDPNIEQMIDQRLVLDSGDYQAAERLYQSGMSNGFQVQLRSDVADFLVERFPNGKLADGIKRYEKVRGQKYFYGYQDGWYKAEGKDFDKPEQGIKGWLGFIKDFPLHPAADDAAYRLARCYQMTGKYTEALYWFNQATQTGDGDIAYDAAGQFLYTLDAAMASKDFAGLDENRLPDWSKPLIQYSQSVEELRDNNYTEAVSALQAFITAYDEQDIFVAMFKNDLPQSSSKISFGGAAAQYYPFWQEVKAQLELAKRMSELAQAVEQAEGQAKAQVQYDLAAEIYHEPLLFYNHLWRGGRQDFFGAGQIKYMDYDPLLDNYISRFNNYAQAVKAFKSIDLDQSDADVGAKTLFSMALSYSKLIDYGQEVSFYDTSTHLGQQLINAAKNLITRYPDSSLADDAMMLIYNYTDEKQLLEEIIKQYPTGDQAEKAQKLLDTQSNQQQNSFRWDPLKSSALTQNLSRADWRIPEEVKGWLESVGTGEYHGLKTISGWTYIYVRADKDQSLISLNVLNDLNGTTITYLLQPAENIYGNMNQEQLLRLPSRFIQFDKSVHWEQIK